MARVTKIDPAAEIADLKAKQVKIAIERDEARRLMQAAYAALEIPERGPNAVGVGTFHKLAPGELTIPERFKAAEAARALEQKHEPLEAIEKDERDAHAALRTNSRRVESLSEAVKTRGEEIEKIEETHIEWLRGLAEAGTSGAEEQMDQLLKVFDATTQALSDWQGRWSRVRQAEMRIGGNVTAMVSTRELDHIRREIDEYRRRFWPGLTEARYRGSQQASPVRPSNAEPLAEIIG
jgi:hypothetical protein